MTTLTFIITAILVITGLAIGIKSLVEISKRNKIRKFRENLSNGSICKVHYGEGKETYIGTVTRSSKDLIYVSFDSTEDHPIDKDGHKINLKSYKLNEVYPA